MTTQPHLIPPAAPRAAADDVQDLCDRLAGRGWRLAVDLAAELGLPPTEQAKRLIRLLASASAGRIGSGARGYKLVTEMTADEYGHFDAALASQEAEMKRRRVEAGRVFHARTRLHAPAAGTFCGGAPAGDPRHAPNGTDPSTPLRDPFSPTHEAR